MNSSRANCDDRNPVEVSVLVELDNLRTYDHSRLGRLLDVLADRIQEFDRPVEVLIGTPGDRVPTWVTDVVASTGIARAVEPHSIRAVPVGDRLYYAIKNALALEAIGEVLVFLDCDVVPLEGWLGELVSPLEDERVDVVNSRVVVGPLHGRFSRAVAATWIFDVRRPTGVEAVEQFFANSLAVRRAAFEAHPFPDDPEEYRGAEVRLAKELRRIKVNVVQANDAVVLHPPLTPVRRYVLWHMLDGQDFALHFRDEPSAVYWRRAARSIVGRTRKAGRNAFARRQTLDMGWLELAGALALGVAGAVLTFAGAAVGRIRPMLLRRYL